MAFLIRSLKGMRKQAVHITGARVFQAGTSANTVMQMLGTFQGRQRRGAGGDWVRGRGSR